MGQNGDKAGPPAGRQSHGQHSASRACRRPGQAGDKQSGRETRQEREKTGCGSGLRRFSRLTRSTTLPPLRGACAILEPRQTRGKPAFPRTREMVRCGGRMRQRKSSGAGRGPPPTNKRPADGRPHARSRSISASARAAERRPAPTPRWTGRVVPLFTDLTPFVRQARVRADRVEERQPAAGVRPADPAGRAGAVAAAVPAPAEFVRDGFSAGLPAARRRRVDGPRRHGEPDALVQDQVALFAMSTVGVS